MRSGPLRDIYGPPGPPKRSVLATGGPFGARTGPNIGFWLLSPVGWGHMGQNGAVRSGHTVALLWTPHMPIFRRKFYGPPKGPPVAKTSPSGGPGVPVEVPEHMTSMLPTQLDQSVTVGTKLGPWGPLRTSRALQGPVGPQKGLFRSTRTSRAPKRPFWASGGTYMAPGWAKMTSTYVLYMWGVI